MDVDIILSGTSLTVLLPYKEEREIPVKLKLNLKRMIV